MIINEKDYEKVKKFSELKGYNQACTDIVGEIKMRHELGMEVNALMVMEIMTKLALKLDKELQTHA